MTLASKQKEPRNTLRMVIGAILTAAVCFFVARSLVLQWDSIKAFDWTLRPWWLLLSAVLMWLDFVLLFQLWRIVLRSISGHELRFASAYRILTLSNLGKYIPGKIWTITGMVYLVGLEGVPPKPALVSSALHQAFTLIPGAVFATSVLGIGIWGDLSPVVVAAGMALGVLLLYPPIFRKLMNLGLRVFGREPIDFQLSFAKAFGLFWLYIAAWVLYGASFWCLNFGIGLPDSPFWPVSAAYCAAYIVGFVAIFAPGGLGVREGVLAVVLAPYLPTGLAAAVAVVSRFWMTLVELAGMVPVLFGYGKRKLSD